MNHQHNQGDEQSKCERCGKPESPTTRLKRCSACQKIMYCSVKCQRADWADHKEVCRILQSIDRAMAGATRRGPNDPFWASFWDQATPENIKKLYQDEIAIWKVDLDKDNNNDLVVTDVMDEVVVGHGPCPESSEDVLKALYACMIMPENDHRPRRPSSITLGINLVDDHHKYLWSELLRVRLPIYPDNEEGKLESRDCATFPIKRWGKYAKGETFYEPQVNLRIEWWGDEKRREQFERMGWGETTESFAKTIMEFPDLENKEPRWARDYESWEDCLEDLGGVDEIERKHWQEEICDWQHDYKSVEELCLDLYGAKTIEECVWDYAGVPRLFTDDDDADKILDKAGWECQGYKVGRCFTITEESVKLGKRLIHFKGHFVWEEKKPPKESREDMFQSYMNTLRG